MRSWVGCGFDGAPEIGLGREGTREREGERDISLPTSSSRGEWIEAALNVEKFSEVRNLGSTFFHRPKSRE